MKQVVFIDYKDTQPYSVESLGDGVLNGTAGSVIHVAESLGLDYEVFVLQRNLETIIRGHNRVTYGPLEFVQKVPNPHAVITVRLGHLTHHSIELYPKSRHIIWSHNTPDHHCCSSFRQIRDVGASIICVSKYHLECTKTLFTSYHLPFEKMSLGYIYNPIEDDLTADSTPVNSHKLFFASNPMKGLANTLDCFDALREVDPRFQLYIANPSSLIRGYHVSSREHVHALGNLSHKQTIKHIRESLCLFYPNYCYPETFGLVFAESSAVGTPVLTHNLGSADEILNNPHLLVDATYPEKVVKKVIEWSKGGRPLVEVNDEFRISEVAKKWKELLDE